jgi:hypothetical protein
MKQEFLAIMLGVWRPTVTVVMRSLQELGLMSSRYGRIRILKRKALEDTACECYGAMRVEVYGVHRSAVTAPPYPGYTHRSCFSEP